MRSAITDALDPLENGDEITVRVAPTNKYVIEITSQDREILNADDAQQWMKNNAVAFRGLGIFLWAGAAYLIIYGIYVLIKEKSFE